MSHLLHSGSAWVMMSVPLFFALTGPLKGRAKSIAVWAYLWLLAGLLAACTWDLAGMRPPEASVALEMRLWVWGSAVGAVVGLVLPVVWYWHDTRKSPNT